MKKRKVLVLFITILLSVLLLAVLLLLRSFIIVVEDPRVGIKPGSVNEIKSDSAFSQVWNSGRISVGHTSENSRNSYIDGNYLYSVSHSAQTLVIYDISNPLNPVQKSLTTLPYGGLDVRKKGNYLFISSSIGVLVYDVSNVKSPSHVRTVYLGDRLHGMFLSGNYLYVTQHLIHRFVILDVTNPASPKVRGTLKGKRYFYGAHDVHVDGIYAYVVNYLPGRLIPPYNLVYMETHAIFGPIYELINKLFYIKLQFAEFLGIGGRQFGLTVVDVSDVDSPKIVAGVGNTHKNSHIYKVGNYVYVGSHHPDCGLTVWDVSTPSNPVFKGRFFNKINSMGYWIVPYDKNTLAMIAPGTNSLYLVDITNPASPSITASVLIGQMVKPANVVVKGDYFYVSCTDESTYEWYIYTYKKIMRDK